MWRDEASDQRAGGAAKPLAPSGQRGKPQPLRGGFAEQNRGDKIARAGFEPTDVGIKNRCLTTWRPGSVG